MLERILKKYGFVDYTDASHRTFRLSKAVLTEDKKHYSVPVERNGINVGNLIIKAVV